MYIKISEQIKPLIKEDLRAATKPKIKKKRRKTLKERHKVMNKEIEEINKKKIIIDEVCDEGDIDEEIAKATALVADIKPSSPYCKRKNAHSIEIGWSNIIYHGCQVKTYILEGRQLRSTEPFTIYYKGPKLFIKINAFPNTAYNLRLKGIIDGNEETPWSLEVIISSSPLRGQSPIPLQIDTNLANQYNTIGTPTTLHSIGNSTPLGIRLNSISTPIPNSYIRARL